MGLLNGLKAAKARSQQSKLESARVADEAYTLLAAGEWVKLRECVWRWNGLEKWNGVPWILHIIAGMYGVPMLLSDRETFDQYTDRATAIAARKWLEGHRTDPGFAGPFVQAALAFFLSCEESRESLEASVRILEAALAAHPDHPLILAALGMALSGTEKSLEYFRLAIAGRARFTLAQYYFGQTLMNMRKWEEARRCFEILLGWEPELHLAHFRLAFVLYQLEEIELSKSSYEKVIQLAPESESAGEARQILSRFFPKG